MPIVPEVVEGACAGEAAAVRWAVFWFGLVAGLVLGLVAGAWFGSRTEPSPVVGRIQMRMKAIEQRRKLRAYMERTSTPPGRLRRVVPEEPGAS